MRIYLPNSAHLQNFAGFVRKYDETVDDMVFFQTELQEFTLSLKVNISFLNDYSRNDFKNVGEQKMFILANSETV